MYVCVYKYLPTDKQYIQKKLREIKFVFVNTEHKETNTKKKFIFIIRKNKIIFRCRGGCGVKRTMSTTPTTQLTSIELSGCQYEQTYVD